MNQKYTIGLVSLILACGVGLTAYAQGGGFGKGNPDSAEIQKMQQKMDEMKIQQTEMQSAMENNDYNSWQTIMNERVTNEQERVNKMKEAITQENFNIMVEMHNAIQSGDTEKAKELRSQLGDSMMMGGFGRPMMGGHGRGMHDFDSSESAGESDETTESAE